MKSLIKYKKSIIGSNLFYSPNTVMGILKYAIDMAAIIACYYLSYLIRFEGHMPPVPFYIFIKTLPVYFICFFVSEVFFGLGRSVWRYVSVRDLERIMAFVAGGNGLLLMANALLPASFLTEIPRSIYLINALLLLIVMGGIRIVHRITIEQFRAFYSKASLSRVLIVGDGDVAASLQSDIVKDHSEKYKVAGFITRDESRIGATINATPIIGHLKDIKKIVKEKDIKYIFIAVDKASTKEMKDIIRLCERTGAVAKIIPSFTDVVEGKFGIKDAREIKFEDYLHREPVALDLMAIKKDFEGKTILITGAGGAIGSQISRELSKILCNKLILLDHFEGNIFTVYNELVFSRKEVMAKEIKPIIGDVRNADTLRHIFSKEKVDYVIHAAAHKHVFLSELNPAETVKTNICGTYNVAEIAGEAKVAKFIFISTDKAVDPVSVMGATKRAGEMIVQAFSGVYETKYVTVRFGNVIGSQGNVIQIFQHEVLCDEPITITHPEAERYFMSIEEAVKLVLQAASIGESGDLFVLDMGDPIKIRDLAHDICTFYGKNFDDEKVNYIGLRPGERLTERLISEREQESPAGVKKTMKVVCKEKTQQKDVINEVKMLCAEVNSMEDGQILEKLHNIVPEYH